MADERERRPSPAKAAIAQTKPRDASGRFLSGDELAAYQAQQQQAQFAAERAKLDSVLGRMPMQPTQSVQPMQGPQPMQPILQDNFQAILNANKPGNIGQGQSPDNEQDKWDILLGKKRTNIRW